MQSRSAVTRVFVVLMLFVAGAAHAQQWSGNSNTTDPITRTGPVGIGTSALSTWESTYRPLHLGSTAVFAGRSNGLGLELGDNYYRDASSVYRYIGAGTANALMTSSGDWTFFTAANGTAGGAITWLQPLSIKNNGTVGIGTTSPAAGYMVDVNGGGGIRSVAGASSFGGMTTQADTTALGQFLTLGSSRGDTYFGRAAANWSVLYSSGAASNGLLLGTYTNKPLVLGANNTEYQRIDSDGQITMTGNLGIGVSPGATPLFTTKTGVNLTGTSYYIARFDQPGNARGTLIGYDTAGGAVIAATGSAVPVAFWTNNGTATGERMRIDPFGKVGIGLTNPSGNLHVFNAGDAQQIIQTSSATNYAYTRYWIAANSTVNDAAAGIMFQQGAGTFAAGNRFWNIGFNPNKDYFQIYGGNAGNARLIITAGGNVGIGTQTPANPLSVAGVIQSTSGGFTFPDGTTQTTAAVSPNGSGNYTFGGNVGIGADPTSIPLYASKAGAPLGGTGYYVGRFDNAGSTAGVVVGYDTANGGLIAATGAKPLAFWSYNGTSWAESMRMTTAGNVGIGNTAPNAALHITRSASTLQTVGNENRLLQLGSDYNGNTNGGQFEFRERRFSTASSSNHALAIYGKSTADATQVADKFLMTIQADGKVGIGNIAPAKTLDVTGDIYASGTISGGNVIAQYQDVAEWVPSGETLTPGTVVIINPSKTNEVMPSSQAYDTSVAGVVSEKPGVLLGIAGETKSKIATTGRVRVHVDATARAINTGDLLVTSSKPGVAMASEPIDLGGVKLHRPGTLIGKALEPLKGGEGDILVLLSLQ